MLLLANRNEDPGTTQAYGGDSKFLILDEKRMGATRCVRRDVQWCDNITFLFESTRWGGIIVQKTVV